MHECLLHYVWKHLLFSHENTFTQDGEKLDILYVGRHNTNAGPDFFGAHIKLGGIDWVGNVEIHQRSSDWYSHNHNKDSHYNNVILHVVGNCDKDVYDSSGRKIPQLVIGIPDFVRKNYNILQSDEDFCPCYSSIRGKSDRYLTEFYDALGRERLERKSQEVAMRLKYCDNDWEQVFFITMSRAFGFGLNSDCFERWARILPYRGAAKHRDSSMQIEALFLGAAGFLEAPSNGIDDCYYEEIRREYCFLRQKFDFEPMDSSGWRFLRLRPQNFPTLRLAQFAALYSKGQLNLSRVIEADSVNDVEQLLSAQVTPYWQNHYTLLSPSVPHRFISLNSATKHLLVINGMVPVMYAYGEYRGDKELQQKAIMWLKQLPCENNKYTRLFEKGGERVHTAMQSQAVIQLLTMYCERKDCLRCLLGDEFIRTNTIQ